MSQAGFVRRVVSLLAVAAVAAAGTAEAQMAHRMRGTVRSTAGDPVPEARVRLEAIAGFRGEQFVGQKDFTATANARGEWTVLGVTAGVWVIEASAPGHLPQIFVLTIDLVTRKPISAVGGMLKWAVPFELQPVAGRDTLARAATAALEGALADAVTSLGAAASEAALPDDLVAAGETALIARQDGLARTLFEQALEKTPGHARAMIGLGAAALIRLNWDEASKRYWAAREAAPRELRPALAATITDLQQVTQGGGWDYR